jgi:hypothetical protein
MHNFTIDYTDGLVINNNHYDAEYAKDKDKHYKVITYFLHKKIKRSLQTYPIHYIINICQFLSAKITLLSNYPSL